MNTPKPHPRNMAIWAVVDADSKRQLYMSTDKRSCYEWAVKNLALTVPWVVIEL